jgi:hypothetical protein
VEKHIFSFQVTSIVVLSILHPPWFSSFMRAPRRQYAAVIMKQEGLK